MNTFIFALVILTINLISATVNTLYILKETEGLGVIYAVGNAACVGFIIGFLIFNNPFKIVS